MELRGRCSSNSRAATGSKSGEGRFLKTASHLVTFADDVEAREPAAEPPSPHTDSDSQAGIVWSYNDVAISDAEGFGRDFFRPKVAFISGRGRTRRHSHAYPCS